MMMMDSRNFGCCNKETKTDDNSFNALINYQLNSVFKMTGKPTHEVFVRVGNFVVALTVFKKTPLRGRKAGQKETLLRQLWTARKFTLGILRATPSCRFDVVSLRAPISLKV